MELGDSITVFGDWFFIHFVENPGMAFGWEFGGEIGKYALTIFRIIAVIAITIYIYKISRKKTSNILLFSLSLILAGAIGNIIDSLFYGLIFSESNYFQLATLFPPSGEHYAGFMQGKVVDMFYFPIIEGNYPNWIPWLGGDSFIFFRPIFNVADASITTGVILILLFQKKLFK
jgi:signal peptidase II